MWVKRLGIDLGTANVLVYEVGRGVVLQEPSVVAMPVDGDEILAVGEEARAMYG
ncbi:MAG: rod shape-determining protein, partial [Thermoflexus sp.]